MELLNSKTNHALELDVEHSYERFFWRFFAWRRPMDEFLFLTSAAPENPWIRKTSFSKKLINQKFVLDIFQQFKILLLWEMNYCQK